MRLVALWICAVRALLVFVSRGQQCNEHNVFTTDVPEIQKTVLNHEKHLNSFNNSQFCLNFLRKCLDTDIIPNVLRFRVPKNGVFSDQAVHSFQIKLFRTEMGRAKEERGRAAEGFGKVRDIVRRTIVERLWPSVTKNVLRQARDNALATRLSHSKKIEKLDDRQNRPPGKLHKKAVKVLNDMKMPGWVDELLSMGPKHPVRDKFNEVHFLADIDFFSELNEEA